MAKQSAKRGESIHRIPVSRLHRNPWGLEVGPPLSSEDEELLRLSIQKDGIQIPLVAWQHGKRLVVLSGSNRLRIAKQLRIKTVPVIIRQFADQNAAKVFAVCDNLARRQLNTGQRAYLAFQYQQLLAVGAGRPRRGEILTDLSKLNARRSAAERAGVSQGAVSAIKAVVEDGDDDLLQSVLRGEVAVTAAARYVKTEARTAKLPTTTGGNGHPSSDPVFTIIHGDSADLIEQVARLYLKRGDIIYDVTVGQSVFWQQVDLRGCKFFGTDLALKPSVDLRKLPYANGSADLVVLDPPHQHDVGVPITGARYDARRTVRKMSHDAIIGKLYGDGLREIWRVLKPGGLCWIKTCDEVVAGRQRWSHLEVLKIAEELGFTAIDLFILHRSATTPIQHARQLHARKNHSFLWVFEKPPGSKRRSGRQ